LTDEASRLLPQSGRGDAVLPTDQANGGTTLTALERAKDIFGTGCTTTMLALLKKFQRARMRNVTGDVRNGDVGSDMRLPRGDQQSLTLGP